MIKVLEGKGAELVSRSNLDDCEKHKQDYIKSFRKRNYMSHIYIN